MVKQKGDLNKPTKKKRKNNKLMQQKNERTAGQHITDRILKVLHTTSQKDCKFIDIFSRTPKHRIRIL